MLKDVQKNGKPLVVTLRGEPIARVEPVAKGKKRQLGALKGRMIIKGDIFSREELIVDGSLQIEPTSYRSRRGQHGGALPEPGR